MVRHELSLENKASLDRWCQVTPGHEILYEDSIRGVVQAIDIMQLLCPSELSVGLLSHLLFSEFPATHSSVTIVDQAVMTVIYGRLWDEAYVDVTTLAHHSLVNLLDTLWTKEWVVFPFLSRSHFTGVLVQYNRLDTSNGSFLHGNLKYIDSFLSENPDQAHLVLDFIDWTYSRSSPTITSGQWETDLRTTNVSGTRSARRSEETH